MMALFQELGRTLEHGKEGWEEKWPGRGLIAGAVFKYLSKWSAGNCAEELFVSCSIINVVCITLLFVLFSLKFQCHHRGLRISGFFLISYF